MSCCDLYGRVTSASKERRATCQSLISDLSGVESPSARDKGTSPGRAEAAATPLSERLHTAPLLCATVYSAGSQLPLEGTEMYLFAQMVKSRFCNASCATVKWN